MDVDGRPDYDVVIYPCSSLDRILELKEVDFKVQRPRKIEIRPTFDDDWSHEILGALLDVFHYFEENGIFWEELELDCSESDRTYTRPVIRTANSLSLFNKMNITVLQREETDESDFMCAGITHNDRLETLQFNSDYESVVAPLGDSRALSRYLQTTSSLNVWKIKNSCQFHQELICEGLSGNDTLQKLHLDLQFLYGSVYYDDNALSNIITSLTTHSTLGELKIEAMNQFGDLSSQAIERLLINSSTLHTLVLLDYGNGSKLLNVENIVQGLKYNRSIKNLTLFDALSGDMIFSKIFHALHNNHSLEKLTLGIKDKDGAKQDLDQFVQMDRLSRPIELAFTNPFISDCESFELSHVKEMEQLLHFHPEVRPLLPYPHRVSSKLAYICELNWHGRYLLDRQNVPLSLWPLVLEKAKNKRSVLYEFLKGPVFAARS